MTELIRSACLTAFPEVARSVGLRPEALMSSVGIDRRALTDTEMRISIQAVGQLLEQAAQQSKVDTFGLRLAETRNLSILGPIGLLLREEPTVRHATRSLIKYISLHSEAIVVRLAEIDGQAVASTEFRLARQRAFRQGVELTIGVLFRVLQSLIGRHWQPTVCFTHGPPARRDAHHRLFGPRVDFRCSFNGLIFPSDDLARPVPSADPAFADQARRYLDSLVQSTGTGFKAKVEELVRVQLSSGRCTADRLALQMGCDRRTLHRKLTAERATFDTILDSVRTELAVRLLQNREAGLASAADLLGFSSSSAFSRWFLGSFGKRPSEWRRDLEAV